MNKSRQLKNNFRDTVLLPFYLWIKFFCVKTLSRIGIGSYRAFLHQQHLNAILLAEQKGTVVCLAAEDEDDFIDHLEILQRHPVKAVFITTGKLSDEDAMKIARRYEVLARRMKTTNSGTVMLPEDESNLYISSGSFITTTPQP